jgi:hypothetical protein
VFHGIPPAAPRHGGCPFRRGKRAVEHCFITRLLRENDTQQLNDHLNDLTDDEVGSLLGESLVERKVTND